MNYLKFSALIIVGVLAACSKNENKPEAYEEPEKIIVERAPEEKAKTLTELGLGYYRLGKYKYALEYLDSALALDESNAVTYQVIGLINMRQHQSGLAEKNFKSAIKLDPENFDILTDYAVFLYGQKRFDQALEAFTKVVAASFYKNKWVAYTYLGYYELEKGNKLPAEKKFYYALKLNKRYPPALLEMSKLRYGQAKMMSARAYIERYFTATGKTLPGLRLGIKIENALQDNEQAEQYELELRRNFPYAEPEK